MQRIVYCPNEDYIEQASFIAKKTSLPIVVGISESISSIDFDKDSVLVLSVPENRSVVYRKIVSPGFHQSVRYTNEFMQIYNGVKLLCGEETIYPVMREKHYCQFIYACNNVGDYSFSIFLDDNEIETGDYVVC